MFKRTNLAVLTAIAVFAVGLSAPARASHHTATLTVTVSGSGTVSGEGIDCGNGGADCTETYSTCLQWDPVEQYCAEPNYPEITLTAAASAGDTLGWGGACSGAASTCTVTMTGNRSVSASFVDADAVAPSVAITNPPNSFVRQTTLLTASASDSSGVSEVSFAYSSASGWVPIGTDSNGADGWSVGWNTTSVASGPWQVRATARDTASNVADSAAVTLRVDNVTPSAELTNPAADVSYVGGERELWATASDSPADGVAEVRFFWRTPGTLAWNLIATDTTAQDSNYYFARWDTSARPNEAHDLGLQVRDHAGNETTIQHWRTVTVDNENPTVSLANVSDGALLRGRLTLTAEASDSHSGIDFVRFDVGSTSIGWDEDGAPYSVVWDTTTLPDGQHAVEVKAVDNARNFVFTDPITVTVDNTRPNTKITKGPRRTTNKRRATFYFKSSEASSTFLCKLDKGAWRKCSTPRSSRNLRKGYHTFRVQARDRAGNVDTTPAKKTWRIV